ncbi:hypothetical protein CEXT_567171 [Caerostris extrusa]|uniref:Uncharacterized protein n=1 Tax=Caerostris extrusa TaxID=172846 RepID=A0AAV4Q9D7_CAEEX|nr:hypothetical protein CEXT_567171 [Caerostris extrusa]
MIRIAQGRKAGEIRRGNPQPVAPKLRFKEWKRTRENALFLIFPLEENDSNRSTTKADEIRKANPQTLFVSVKANPVKEEDFAAFETLLNFKFLNCVSKNGKGLSF